MKILAIVGKSGSNKEKLLQSIDWEKVELFDFGNETEQLLKSGDEGHRQIMNYFGEEYLYKDGRVNLNKLWKFIYQDFHKLKIFNFLMEPLLFNQIQKKLDGTSKQFCLVLLPGLVEINNYQRFDEIFWLDLDKEAVLLNLRGKSLPVSAEKYLDTQSRLFLKPARPMILCKTKDELVDQVEKWLNFV